MVRGLPWNQLLVVMDRYEQYMREIAGMREMERMHGNDRMTEWGRHQGQPGFDENAIKKVKKRFAREEREDRKEEDQRRRRKHKKRHGGRRHHSYSSSSSSDSSGYSSDSSLDSRRHRR